MAAGGRVFASGRSVSAAGDATLRLAAHDAAVGHALWTRSEVEPFPCCDASPEVSPVAVRGEAVAAVHLRLLLLLSAATGEARWSASLGEAIAGPASFVGGAIVVGQDGTAHPDAHAQVQVRDAATGTLRWAAGRTPGTHVLGAIETFGLDGLLVGNFRVGIPTEAGLRGGLVAFGPDRVPPAWLPGPTLQLTENAPGQKGLLRGGVDDLNLAGARVEVASAASGPWAEAGWMPYVPFSPAESQAWALPAASAQDRFYRVVPVDKAGLSGPPSAVVRHGLPPPPPPPPPSAAVLTVAGPAPNATVSGQVE
ncbi:MAG TPA: PQQ-binding-like beta-propeller repeat protein, partial [Candidatus Thermoplasmatota archaeon]|nr:PQQ-binding-like beta-propeller repeat protein [Candidatus Thermoplasmatota archaeon]